MDKLERLNEDDKFRTDYNVELVRRKEINSARLDGYDDGKAEGLEAGAKAREKEIAKNLLKDGIPIEVVSKNTGLSIEELEELKKEA